MSISIDLLNLDAKIFPKGPNLKCNQNNGTIFSKRFIHALPLGISKKPNIRFQVSKWRKTIHAFSLSAFPLNTTISTHSTQNHNWVNVKKNVHIYDSNINEQGIHVPGCFANRN